MKGAAQGGQEQFFTEQVARLRALRFFPSDDIARGELVKSLWRHGKSESHAERMIDHALTHGFGEDGRECPTAPDFAILAGEVSPLEIQFRPSGSCALCGGSGWEIQEYSEQTGIFNGESRTAARRCVCSRVTA